MTVTVVVRLTPSYVAVMVTDVFVLTLVVVTVKPTAVVPAPTVTLAGTLATAGLLLDSDTIAPPGGAPPDSVTNPDVFEPPATLDGLTVTLCRVGSGGRRRDGQRRRSRDAVVRRGDRDRRGRGDGGGVDDEACR